MGQKGSRDMKINPYKNMEPYRDKDGGAGGGDTDPTPNPTPTPKEDPKPKTFDEILENKDYQAEFDRRVKKGIDTALEKERKRLESIYNDKLTEQERLAKMNEEEKLKYQNEQKEKEMAERERNITKRELTAEAKNMLAEKNLPADLVDVVVLDSAESVTKSIDAIEKSFADAVEKAVDERLKGQKPPKDASTEKDPEDPEAKVDAELRKNLAKYKK